MKLVVETPLARLHRELAEYKRLRDEALTNLTLALVEIAREVNGTPEPDPDDWFAIGRQIVRDDQELRSAS